jgi:hypothetical protein
VFTYSSHQSAAVSIVITTFTIVTSSALRECLACNIDLYHSDRIHTVVCVGLWFASERWAYARTKGKRWLLDIIEEHTQKAGVATGVTPAKRAATMGVKRTRTFVSGIGRSMTNTSRRVTGVTGRMSEAMSSFVNVPRTLVSRTMSSLAIMTDGLNGSDPRDEESQDGMRTDSPTNMFNTENGSGNLGVNSNSEKRKLSDIGKGMEDTIHEDKLLVVNTLAPVLTASPPSAGGSSRLISDEPVPETKKGNTEPAGPTTPRNAKFRAIAKQVSTIFSDDPVLSFDTYA